MPRRRRCARFEQVFATYGMPQVIRSDNGPPFASPNGLLGLSALSAWWLAVGISLDRIDPGRPDQNGSHERMHRDMALELQARARGDLDQQRAALSIWREEYNTTRPHEALGMRTPAELYTSSPRKFAGTPEQLCYGQGFATRRVKGCGTIKLDRAEIFLSTALRGWDVGLRAEQDARVGVWFGNLRLGAIDPKTQGFAPATPAVEMPP